MTGDAVYARSFARALHGAAVANRETDRVRQDVLTLEQQWRDSPELRQFCQRRLSGPRERIAAVETVWGQTLSRTVVILLKAVARWGHLGLLPQIAGRYRRLDDLAQDCRTVTMRFAYEPGAAQVERVCELITRAFAPKTLRRDVAVEPALIAGVRFSVGDTRVDASLAGRMARLRVGLRQPAALDDTTDFRSKPE
ncbi:MAG: F0F1 ATP synthase subunit delta [Verrucomicrobiota bacterium]|jgi:F-type H+-transporting ATPase subunit delta|nr:F0F1 ATP synthase subunit delta [Verrucomicrobiota bacterium]